MHPHGSGPAHPGQSPRPIAWGYRGAVQLPRPPSPAHEWSWDWEQVDWLSPGAKVCNRMEGCQCGGRGRGRNWRLRCGIWWPRYRPGVGYGRRRWDAREDCVSPFHWFRMSGYPRAVRAPQGPGWELCPVLGRGRGWEGGRVDMRDREGVTPGAHREGGREVVEGFEGERRLGLWEEGAISSKKKGENSRGGFHTYRMSKLLHFNTKPSRYPFWRLS